VPAFGYRLATIPIHGADGQRIALSRGSVQVGPDARLLTEDNRALPNVFGVGLGSGFRPWGGMAGEASFGGQQNSLWLYQNGLGKLIHDGVRAHAAVRRGRVRGWRHVVLSSLRAGCVGVPPKAEPALTIGERTPLPPAAG